MRKGLALCLCLALLALFAAFSGSMAAARESMANEDGSNGGTGLNTVTGHNIGMSRQKQAIIVVANRVSFADLAERSLPNIKELAKMGGLGLMTVNTAGEMTDSSAYYTVGTSRRLAAGFGAGAFYNAQEVVDGAKTADVFFRNTGLSVSPREVVNAYVSSFGRRLQFPGNSVAGTLGDVLHQNRLKTAVIGNSDGPRDKNFFYNNRFLFDIVRKAKNNESLDKNFRFAPLIVADSAGRVDFGDVSANLLVADSRYPFGRRTDYGRLEEKFSNYLQVADVLVVETGDTFRTELESPFMSERRLLQQKDADLAALDNFIGNILPLVNDKRMLILVSMLPSEAGLKEGDIVAPVIAAGGKIRGRSVFTSNTTRWDGLISNHDIAPTVLQHFGIAKPDTMSGLPLTGLAYSEYGRGLENSPQANWIKVAKERINLTTAYRQRQPVLNSYLKYLTLVLPLMAVVLIFRWSFGYKPFKIMVLSTFVAPPVLLLLPLLGRYPLYIEGLLAVGLIVLGVILLWTVKKPYILWLAGALLYLLPALGDIFLGGFLASHSALGFDPLIGGRFYGIGNESMGMVLASAILLLAALLRQWPQHRLPLLMAGTLFLSTVVITFAAPMLGTNAGGTLAAVAGFSVALYFFYGFRMKIRALIILAAVFVAGLSSLMLINVLFSFGRQSHIGRAVDSLQQGNYKIISETIVRKLATNAHLLGTVWMQVIIIALLSIAVVVIFRKKELLEALAGREIKASLLGIGAGLVAAVFFNDTGITSAAVILSWVSPVMFLYVYDSTIGPGQEEKNCTESGLSQDCNG